MLCVPSNHQLPKACVFGYIVVSKVDDRKGWEFLLRAQAEELLHHIVHQPHNTHAVGENIQLRQLHEPSLASTVNSMFVPLGFLASDNSTFYLHCNTTALSLNFVINNLTFLINAVDLKRHASQPLCISLVTADFNGHYVLGDLFLRNVLLTFDFKASNFWLAPRPYYES